MTFAVQFRRFFRHVGSLLLSFAHGGIVVAGLMAMAFLGGVLTGQFNPVAVLQADAGRLLSDGQSAAESSDGVTEIAADSELSPRMRVVADYLSKRYRVSVMAVEPLVAAAEQAGQRVGLDPLLLLAVVAIESRFNPIAESVMGAQGLMQVIPKFHQDKLAEAEEDALLDPVKNIQVGALVLKESIRRAGSLQGGLQQYAGAPGDSEAQYASKVMAEKQRLEEALRRSRGAMREA